MQVTDGLVGLLGRRVLGGGGRGHGFGGDGHLADWAIIQTSGYTPQLSKLDAKKDTTFMAVRINKKYL